MIRLVFSPDRILLCLLVPVFLWIGCDSSSVRPLTKERYLIRFHSFIQGIENQGHTYNLATWKESDLQYKLFKTTWYNRFRNELTPEDKVLVRTLMLRYHKVKLIATGHSLLDQAEDALLEVETWFIEND